MKIYLYKKECVNLLPNSEKMFSIFNKVAKIRLYFLNIGVLKNQEILFCCFPFVYSRTYSIFVKNSYLLKISSD